MYLPLTPVFVVVKRATRSSRLAICSLCSGSVNERIQVHATPDCSAPLLSFAASRNRTESIPHRLFSMRSPRRCKDLPPHAWAAGPRARMRTLLRPRCSRRTAACVACAGARFCCACQRLLRHFQAAAVPNNPRAQRSAPSAT